MFLTFLARHTLPFGVLYTRQHLAVYHASACQGARWWISLIHCVGNRGTTRGQRPQPEQRSQKYGHDQHQHNQKRKHHSNHHRHKHSHRNHQKHHVRNHIHHNDMVIRNIDISSTDNKDQHHNHNLHCTETILGSVHIAHWAQLLSPILGPVPAQPGVSQLINCARQRIEYLAFAAKCGSTGGKLEKLKTDACTGILYRPFAPSRA